MANSEQTEAGGTKVAGEVPSGLPSYRDLLTALLEESALAFRYLYFAQIADIEGHSAAATLFRTAAEGATSTTHGTLDILREGNLCDSHLIGDTEQNLQTAIAIETEGATILFPDMARRARENGAADVASWMETLAKLKRGHVESLRRVEEELSDCRDGRQSVCPRRATSDKCTSEL